MTAYYNEIDQFAAQWLRNLINAGHIAPGDVDERSIIEVKPDDIKNYTQCHFFAGIGIWSHALRKAGWSDDRSVWTGSCPCQPFSSAGKRKGNDDERHLFPAWFNLICECRPDVIFGEQVSSKDAITWFDNVQDKLENEEYAIGAIDICAAGIGAPHIRQRLYWVGNTDNKRLQRQRNNEQIIYQKGWQNSKRHSISSNVVTSFWDRWKSITGADEKTRIVTSCYGKVTHEHTSRMGRLRAYGNAIVAEQAKIFIESYLSIIS